MLVFGIAFGTLTVAILTIYMGNRAHCFADAAILNKYNNYKRNDWLDLCFRIVFANVFDFVLEKGTDYVGHQIGLQSRPVPPPARSSCRRPLGLS